MTRKRAVHQRKSPTNLSNAEKVARRDIAIERITEMLAVSPRTVIGMAAELDIPWNTVYGYMRFMQEVGDAHQTGRFDGGRRELWAAGRAKPGQEVDVPDDNPRRAWITPARQVGMFRHWMDEALFGPAQGAAA
jgi:hypothetical protein